MITVKSDIRNIFIKAGDHSALCKTHPNLISPCFYALPLCVWLWTHKMRVVFVASLCPACWSIPLIIRNSDESDKALISMAECLAVCHLLHLSILALATLPTQAAICSEATLSLQAWASGQQASSHCIPSNVICLVKKCSI